MPPIELLICLFAILCFFVACLGLDGYMSYVVGGGDIWVDKKDNYDYWKQSFPLKAYYIERTFVVFCRVRECKWQPRGIKTPYYYNDKQPWLIQTNIVYYKFIPSFVRTHKFI